VRIREKEREREREREREGGREHESDETLIETCDLAVKSESLSKHKAFLLHII